jgi:hypothetical protein
VHTLFGEYSIVDVELDNNVFLGDLGLQEVGKYAGMAVMQTATGKFTAVDITEAQIGHAVHYFDWLENNYNHSVDCCPYSGRIALCDPGTNDDEIDIFDVDGNLLTTLTNGGAEVVCLDFDDNGDIWMIVRSGTTPQLRHLAYTADSPYYNAVPGHTTSITAHYPASQDWIFGDIAIDYEDNMAFVIGCVFEGQGQHYLAAYDISGVPFFLYGRNDVFSGPIEATKAASTNYARRLDIEIDHSLAEYCRIVVSGQLKENGGFRHQLVRLDYKLITMDVYTGEFSYSYQGLPSQIIISPNSPHDLIATPQNLGPVFLFKCDDW